jgi:hypothetical protein
MMKHEEAINKAFKTFTGDEDDALLRLAILKERADYRAYFAGNIGKVKAAYSKRKEERAKRPGHPPDEEIENTIHRFREEMLRNFRILPSSYAARPIEEWASFFDPLKDARTAPAEVRGYILPYLFYWPVVREVVSIIPPEEVVTVLKGKGECPRIVESAECAPFERLYKINLRGKPAQILREFKAALASVYAHRGINPAAYKEWKQDRSRKREEAWQHLKVWKMRRERKGFIEIARTLEIKTSAAKMSFYKAFEMIEERKYNRDDFRRSYWEIRKEELKRTCATCPDRNNCTILCPDVLTFINQDIQDSRELSVGGAAEALRRDGRKRPRPTMDKQESRMRTRKNCFDPS